LGLLYGLKSGVQGPDTQGIVNAQTQMRIPQIKSAILQTRTFFLMVLVDV
jgi:hypothetical protein